MNILEEWLVQNKDEIEKAAEVIGQTAEVLASTVGQFDPVLKAVFMLSAELLGNSESKEARYLSQQFEMVNQQLEGVQNETDQISRELKKTSMNKQNFDSEARILSQYEKFRDFVNAKPEYKKIKKEKFLSHYENTKSDLNLDALYNAVTGENISGEPMLETVVMTEQRSRRVVESFCARLKKLFIMGIIPVMGYAALKGGVREDLVKKWQDQMEDVERRMKAAVDDCTENFVDQAKLDMENKVQESHDPVDHKFMKSLLDFLIQKYDWVNWSIRAFGDEERCFLFKWLAGKKYRGSGGNNWFDISTESKIIVVVSYCVNPQPINKSQIQEEIEGDKVKGNMMEVALSLRKSFPNYLVHAVSCYKQVVEINSFSTDCYYYEKHKKAYLCIHPE